MNPIIQVRGLGKRYRIGAHRREKAAIQACPVAHGREGPSSGLPMRQTRYTLYL
jgi:hypothetical protein